MSVELVFQMPILGIVSAGMNEHPIVVWPVVSLLRAGGMSVAVPDRDLSSVTPIPRDRRFNDHYDMVRLSLVAFLSVRG